MTTKTNSTLPSPWRLRLLLVWQAAWREKRVFILALSVGIFTAVLRSIVPYFTKIQFDQLGQRSDWYLFLLALIVPLILDFIISQWLQRLTNALIDAMETRVRQVQEAKIWQHFATFDIAFFLNNRNQVLMKFGRDAVGVINRALRLISRFTYSTATFLTILPLLLFVNPTVVLMILGAAIVRIILDRVLMARERAYTFVDRQRAERRYGLQRLLDHHFFDITSAGAFTDIMKRYFTISMEDTMADVRRHGTYHPVETFQEILTSLTILVIQIYVGSQVFGQHLSLGDFTLIVGYTDRVRYAISDWLGNIQEWRRLGIDFERLELVFQMKTRLQLPSSQQAMPTIGPEHLVATSVLFEYPDHIATLRDHFQQTIQHYAHDLRHDSYMKEEVEKLKRALAEKVEPHRALQNVDFAVRRGEVVALVGRNGSGKTTLVHLLQHHLEPTAGTITLDGTPLWSLSLKYQRQLFSWVRQETALLADISVEDNLLLGLTKNAQTLERMRKVLEALGLNEMLHKLPHGLKSIVGDDAQFSGGQKQLLLIARAVIQHRPFLFCDEATSQLDPEREAAVFVYLSSLRKDCGIVFVTHRMSVARRADRIVVLDKGRVIEEGKHAELLQQNGLYAQFWHKQVVE